MATHSSVLAWRIPGTGEPGGLPSLGSHRVRHDWSDLAAAAAAAIYMSSYSRSSGSFLIELFIILILSCMSYPVVMYGCESWTVKKAECWRIDAFELWCWRRLLRVPWTARRSKQSILKETSPGCSLEGLMLRLKLQYFGHLMGRVDSLEKTLMLGGFGGRRRRGQQRMAGWHHQLDGHEFEWTPGVGDGQGGLACCDSWGRKESDMTEWLNWTELYELFTYMLFTSHCPSVGN